LTAPIIALFNNKGGVGKTSLSYHLAWMFVDLGLRVLAVDLDPQANLTSSFLDEEALEGLWEQERDRPTVFGAVEPLLTGVGDIAAPRLHEVAPTLRLIPGDLTLSAFEDELSQQWPQAADGKERAFRVLSAFWRLIRRAGQEWPHDLVLLDVGPNLGAINRTALIASDYIILPLAPDIYSIQGMRNLGPTVRTWKAQWGDRVAKRPASTELPLPTAGIEAIGYVVISHSVRLDRPVRAYDKWIARIPQEYRRHVLGLQESEAVAAAQDANCLSMLRHYRSLMPLSQEARKPIFHLRPADGALGAHQNAAQSAGRDFELLARRIAERIKLHIPH
jgi:cellulose biosynthesis protein BcsQ